MSTSCCRGSVLGIAGAFLALLVLLPPAEMPAQDKPSSTPTTKLSTTELPPFSSFATLPGDPALARKFQAVRDYLDTEAWSDAVGLLQAIFEIREDVFVPVTRKDRDGKEIVSWRSARSEARRIFATLPRQAMEAYEIAYGPQARELLDHAKKSHNPELLDQIVHHYEPTRAGLEALQLLGMYHLDRGRSVLAARFFRLALDRPGRDRLPPLGLFQAALAFHRAGDRASRDRMWKLLVSAAPDGVQWGERRVSLEELEKRLNTSVSQRQDALSADWTTFRGDGTRSNRVAATPLRPGKSWRQATAEGEAGEWLQRAVREQQGKDRAVLPGSFPVIVGDRIVYRSQRGIVAADVETGELLWEAPSTLSLDALATDVNTYSHLSGWVETHLGSHPHTLYENSVLGTLSTDRQRVYAVEDLPVLPVPSSYASFRGHAGQGLRLSFAPEMTNAIYHNRLVAIDVETGKVVWERGGRGAKNGPKDELADTYFLGPPLPLSGRLHVLAEYDQELYLVCLESASGAVCWRQKLATPKNRLLLDGPRRLHAAPLAHAEGILVCPTNTGAILGFDLAARRLLWAHAYRQEPAAPPPQEDPLPGRRRFGRRMPPEPPPSLDTHWSLATPMIRGEKVVFTAPDEETVQCLDLHTGSLLWKADRIGGDLYLAGVERDRVLIVGHRHCRALRLNDGQEAWTASHGEPSGQGVFSGGVYYLPLRSAAEGGKPIVCALDVVKGTIVGRTSLGGEVPGNLLFHKGRVFSQSVDAMTSYAPGR